MAKHKPTDESEALRPGWAAPREVKDEPPGSTLNTQGAVSSWIAKATARSGRQYAPALESNHVERGRRADKKTSSR
jgi:hypothetical protein